jgi:hypothetical protein
MSDNLTWPDGKRAAFTIIDDTDDAELPQIRDIYDILRSSGLRTTKTVWVYSPRDPKFVRGDSLAGSEEYLAFIRELIEQGFEIGLHNVGSGSFNREETVAGIELFNRLLGFYPNIHVNHSYNKENIYSGDERFGWPFRFFVRNMYLGYSGFEGTNPTSDYFWGDIHKSKIRWSRSLEVDRLNLMGLVPIPYSQSRFNEYANYFYPSTFCPNQDIFNKKITRKSIDRLVAEGGLSIVYSHFGYYHERGKIDKGFVDTCAVLNEFRDDIWFAPLGEILSYLEKKNGIREIGTLQRMRLEAECLYTRVKYRYVVRLDDYHYKKSLGFRHRADG